MKKLFIFFVLLFLLFFVNGCTGNDNGKKNNDDKIDDKLPVEIDYNSFTYNYKVTVENFNQFYSLSSRFVSVEKGYKLTVSLIQK